MWSIKEELGYNDVSFYNSTTVEEFYGDSVCFTSINVIEGVNDIILDPIYEKMVVIGGNQTYLGKIISNF